MARQGAQKALESLGILEPWLGVLKLNCSRVKKTKGLPPLIQRMIQATARMGQRDLTPMAAVAGAVSEEVADFLASLGGSRIIVNNGGDIALRLHRSETVRVGIRLDVERPECGYRLVVDGRAGIGGIATSGLGGRSFTKGLASAAVCIGSSAAHADAAATALGNSTWVEDPGVETAFAEELYPDTDIPGHRVVTRVGDIEEEKIGEAVHNGLKLASVLIAKGLITAAIVAVKGRVGWTPGLQCRGREFSLRA
jgi:ApbE superfamily uncharacterized protein (UPF0280 family)